MICPGCRRDMIVVEHSNIELDYCPGCQGVWFDSGELALLLENAVFAGSVSPLAHILSTTEVKSPQKKRKCPICWRRMGVLTVGKEPAIVIDCCRQGDGLWFDGGELHHLVGQLVKQPAGKTNHQQQILTFLQEVFQAKE